jgi:arabinofuranan 3-O-arabinosyltransferase
LLDKGSGSTVSASSTASNDPRVRAGAVADDDPSTTWTAAPGDVSPSLELRLPRRELVRGLTLMTSPDAPVAWPQRVAVTAGSAHWLGDLPADGRIAFETAASTDRVQVQILTSTLRSTTSSQTFRTRLLPVGITQLVLDAGPTTVPSVADVVLSCSDGPEVDVDGVPVRLSVRAGRADILAGRPVEATSCAGRPVSLGEGTHTTTLSATKTIEPVALRLSAGAALGRAAPTQTGDQLRIGHWGATSRVAQVRSSGPALLVVRENFNSGWQATLGGRRLPSVQVDGWQQGFVLPAGADGPVHLEFGPQRGFVIGLVGGLGCVLVLLALALVPGRRRDGPELPAGPGKQAYDDIRLPRWTGPAGAAVTLALLAGPAGPVTLAALAAAAVVVWSWRRGLPSWLAPLALMVGAAVVASVPSVRLFTEANDNLTQLLCVAALAVVFVGDGSLRPKRLP